jgi:hypothetical protein
MLLGGVLIVGSGLYVAMGASRERIEVCPLYPLLPKE